MRPFAVSVLLVLTGTAIACLLLLAAGWAR